MASPEPRQHTMKNQSLGAGIWTGFLARDTGMMKLGCYARVSTHDQHTLTLQRDAMAAYAQQRGWSIVHMVTRDRVGGPRAPATGTAHARRTAGHRCHCHLAARSVGRSLADLVGTLRELHALGVGFISLSETLDFTTPTGRAMAGLLAIFAEFEREILREARQSRHRTSPSTRQTPWPTTTLLRRGCAATLCCRSPVSQPLPSS